jgi:phage terminase Nu1 subunit (DNA packaging protein)
MGDLNEWMTITLDDDHASTADVKAGVEQAKGTRPATQELFRYDESWTGTAGSGGSGHSAAQEDAALVEEGVLFEGPCSLMVSVNESYAVVLEGQEEGELRHDDMGVYERIEGKEMNGRGVWQVLGGMQSFLYYYTSNKAWMVSDRVSIEAGKGGCRMYTKSTATTPDQITEQWMVGDSTGWQDAPKLRVRVCSSVEKHAAEQRAEQEQAQALEQAQQSRRLVFEGLANDRNHLMGVYQLMGGEVVNGRAVWQKQGGTKELFLYRAHNNRWLVGDMENMEKGEAFGVMFLATAALTPDQARSSEMCQVYDGRKFVEAAEARFVISHD